MMNTGYGGGYAMHAHVGGSLLGGVGSALSIIFWVLVIILLVRIIKGRHHRHGGKCCGGMCGCDGESDDALNLLKTRYAKGEIDKKEFEEKKKDLIS